MDNFSLEPLVSKRKQIKLLASNYFKMWELFFFPPQIKRYFLCTGFTPGFRKVAYCCVLKNCLAFHLWNESIPFLFLFPTHLHLFSHTNKETNKAGLGGFRRLGCRVWLLFKHEFNLKCFLFASFILHYIPSRSHFPFPSTVSLQRFVTRCFLP